MYPRQNHMRLHEITPGSKDRTLSKHAPELFVECIRLWDLKGLTIEVQARLFSDIRYSGLKPMRSSQFAILQELMRPFWPERKKGLPASYTGAGLAIF